MDNNELRDSLADTLKLLKEDKIDVNKAKAISDIGQTMINSAKLDLEAQKVADKTGAKLPFFDKPEDLDMVPIEPLDFTGVPSTLRPGNREIKIVGNKTIHKVK